MENKAYRQSYYEIVRLSEPQTSYLLTLGVMAVTIEGTIIPGMFPTVLTIPIARPAYL